MNRYIALVLLTLPGILLTIITAIFAWILFPDIVHSQVKQQVRLVEGSGTWAKWREAPIPVYSTFYIYHVTNPDEVETGMVPKIQEKGPYAYRQKRVKVNIKQDNGTNTVKYREQKTYYFDKEESGNNTEDDLVNIINIPLVGVIHTVQKKRFLKLFTGIVLHFIEGKIQDKCYSKICILACHEIIQINEQCFSKYFVWYGTVILEGEPLIKKNVKVKELLFDGFDVTKYTNNLLLKSKLPKEFSGGRFGLFKDKNGTLSKTWEVYTGVENSPDFGKVKTWNGKSEMGFWKKNSDCDKIKGTDGSIFPPFLNKETKLYAFSDDACRNLGFQYSQDVEHLGIRGYRFTGAESELEDPRVNKQNRCYCLEDDIDKCPFAGVISLETCKKAPIWSSPPHFLDSHIRYLKDSGLDPPEREKHETFLDIEPITGLLLRAHARLQINLEIRYNRRAKSLRELKKDQIIFPVMWIDENAEIDDKLANEMKALLFTPMKIVGIGKWVLLVFGVALTIAGLCVSVKKYNLLARIRDRNENDKKGIDFAKPTLPTSVPLKRRRESSKVWADENRIKRDSFLSSRGSITFVD